MANENHYIQKEDLKTELKKLKDTGKVSEELHKMFYMIAEKFSMASNFRYYSYREDMVMEAYMRCVKYADKFDLDNEKNNPFGYFTMVIAREFWKFIAKEKKQQKIKWKIQKQYMIDLEDDGSVTNKSSKDMIKIADERLED